MVKPHPARYSKAILELLGQLVPNGRALDCFAGVGGCFTLENEQREVWGVEIEEEWITDHPRHILADSTRLNEWFKKEFFDSAFTSCVYGNRMSDHHEAKDDSKRHTYRHYLGHPLHENNAGQMYGWNQDYRDLHGKVWSQCWEVLKPGGLFILNTKNFVRQGKVFDVTTLHHRLLQEVGFHWIEEHLVKTPGQRHGANRDLRVGYERINVYRKVTAAG